MIGLGFDKEKQNRWLNFSANVSQFSLRKYYYRSYNIRPDLGLICMKQISDFRWWLIAWIWWLWWWWCWWSWWLWEEVKQIILLAAPFLCSLEDLLATLCEVKKMLEVHKYFLKFKKIFKRQIQGQVQENAPSTNIYFDPWPSKP